MEHKRELLQAIYEVQRLIDSLCVEYNISDGSDGIIQSKLTLLTWYIRGGYFDAS